jgi:hypothetical protein
LSCDLTHPNPVKSPCKKLVQMTLYKVLKVVHSTQVVTKHSFISFDVEDDLTQSPFGKNKEYK